MVAALQGRFAVVDEEGRAWPASEIARLLCECDLTRVVLGADSTVLDLGHKERCFDRRHWKALLASGWRTCAWPGCTMPLRWCQLHHLTWWSRDGRTDQDNLGPYCAFHHGLIHDRDVRVRRLAGGVYEHRGPEGRLIGLSHPSGTAAPRVSVAGVQVPAPPAGPAPGPGPEPEQGASVEQRELWSA